MNNRNIESAILILRISMGIMFIAHGLLKFMVFTLPGTAQFFASVGFPAWSAYPVAYFEVIGGILLVAGFYSRYIAIIAIPVLLGSMSVHIGNGWVFSNANGGWEYPAFLTAIAVVVAILGDGVYSLRHYIQAKSSVTA